MAAALNALKIVAHAWDILVGKADLGRPVDSAGGLREIRSPVDVSRIISSMCRLSALAVAA